MGWTGAEFPAIVDDLLDVLQTPINGTQTIVVHNRRNAKTLLLAFVEQVIELERENQVKGGL